MACPRFLEARSCCFFCELFGLGIKSSAYPKPVNIVLDLRFLFWGYPSWVQSRVVGSLGVSPTTSSVILLGVLLKNQRVFGVRPKVCCITDSWIPFPTALVQRKSTSSPGRRLGKHRMVGKSRMTAGGSPRISPMSQNFSGRLVSVFFGLNLLLG